MSQPMRLLATEIRTDGRIFALYAPSFKAVEDYILNTAKLSSRAAVCTRAGIDPDSKNPADVFTRMREWSFICAAVKESKKQ